MNKLIAFASLRPQVGKTTAGNYIADKYNYEELEMSDPIVYLAKKFFGFNGDKNDPSQRLILQKLGLTGKEIDSTIWFYFSLLKREMSPTEYDGLAHFLMNVFRARLKENGIEKGMPRTFNNRNRVVGYDEIEDRYIFEDTDPPNGIIINGIRSPLEADEVLSLGGAVYLIKRDLEKDKSPSHEVESQLEGYGKFTKIIYNNGSIEDLYLSLDEIIGEK